MPGPPTLTTPNDSLISSHTSTQLCNIVSVSYNGMPQIHLRQLPLPSNTPIPRPTPLTFQNDFRIQSAILPQYTFQAYRPTHRPTNRWDRRQFNNISTYYALLMESDALIIYTSLSFDNKDPDLYSLANPVFVLHRVRKKMGPIMF